MPAAHSRGLAGKCLDGMSMPPTISPSGDEAMTRLVSSVGRTRDRSTVIGLLAGLASGDKLGAPCLSSSSKKFA